MESKIKKKQKKKLEITDKEFQKEVLDSKKTVLLMFWGSWCPVCKRAQPLVQDLAVELDNTTKVLTMNIDRNPHTSTRYDVMGTPNFCIFKNGILVNRRFGSQSKNQLITLISEK